jgi:CheY-like chemotaxis protein
LTETHRPEICLIGVEPALQTALNKALASEYWLTNIASFRNAWSQLPLCPPVMFIVSMPIPDDEACDFMRRLRMEPRFNLLPILAISTGNPILAEDAQRSGADEFISENPIGAETLRFTVTRLLPTETMEA